LAETLVRVVNTRAVKRRVALCTREWGPLDAALRLDPEVEVVFSLGRPEQLDRYLARRRDGSAPPGCSCSHRLLTPSTVAHLKEAGATIIAWTVDSEARARELLAWGVDGITSNDFAMLGRLKDASYS
jgi:glycerophosphoryl diester phosphodiesterase